MDTLKKDMFKSLSNEGTFIDIKTALKGRILEILEHN